MFSFIAKYANWLHTQWPAGEVEKGPYVEENGDTALSGVKVVGDLTGVPLLKFSADTGAKAVQAFCDESSFSPSKDTQDPIYDLAIIGAGVSGLSAAIEAKKQGLHYVLFEASEDFSTIRNFPRRKPIYTYPTEMTPAGELRFASTVKEELLEELHEQQEKAGVKSTKKRIDFIKKTGDGLVLHSDGESIPARRVIVAIGRSGNYRKLGVEGEDLDKVSNRLHDPREFSEKNVLVVGGGDSALEAAISLAEEGAHVTLSYRKKEFARPKPDNIEKIQALTSQASSTGGTLTLRMNTEVKTISPDKVTLEEKSSKEVHTLENDYVFSLIGREPPLAFFRKSGIPITGDWTAAKTLGLIGFFIFCVWMYHWKSGGNLIYNFFAGRAWFPFNLSGGDPRTLWGTLLNSLRDPGFYYSLAYCLCVVGFGVRRIKRRRTPYVKLQTYTLMAMQTIPLFLLPYFLFPWMGNNGLFSNGGIGQWFGDTFFPDGSYWRSFGFILAWPLFIWNVFTEQPVWGWLVLSLVQTFVIIPLLVWRWGKGAYCGWICSCGALAETMGDAHRHKMPHGPFWNKLNMIGQVVLFFAFLLFIFRVLGWVFPSSPFSWLFNGLLKEWGVFSYKYIVDLWMAGVLGVAFYFHYSGRIWCRFACPLAALMHIYARFTRFRIFAEKKKCISCNVCTSVCHQGIDIMNFANKGLPMEDPECVRCSACVQSCPTGVLTFGRFDENENIILDQIAASQIQLQERAHAHRQR